MTKKEHMDLVESTRQNLVLENCDHNVEKPHHKSPCYSIHKKYKHVLVHLAL
jgi:hypothetical protein